jgi:predicted RNA methylase
MLEKARKVLTDRQRELVGRMLVTDNVARYTGGDVIPDWKVLKAVMEALGGSWKRGKTATTGGFAFPDDVDAQEVVRLAHASGEILDPKLVGMFETPDELADTVVRYLPSLRPRPVLLEPSAGRGQLLRAIERAHPDAELACMELLPANVVALVRNGYAPVAGDFLRMSPDDGDYSVDAVVMNPPFGKRADLQHVTHALRFVRPGGALVAIMAAGVLYRQDSYHNAFRAIVEHHNGHFIDNPDGAFKASGTMVRTVTLVIESVG